jgi:hypothetical protein
MECLLCKRLLHGGRWIFLLAGSLSSCYSTGVIRFARCPHYPYRPQPIGTGAVLNPVPLALVPMSSWVYGRRRPWKVSARPLNGIGTIANLLSFWLNGRFPDGAVDRSAGFCAAAR